MFKNVFAVMLFHSSPAVGATNYTYVAKKNKKQPTQKEDSDLWRFKSRKDNILGVLGVSLFLFFCIYLTFTLLTCYYKYFIFMWPEGASNIGNTFHARGAFKCPTWSVT